MPRQSTQVINEKMQECIENCEDCHRACVTTFAHCLRQGDEHFAPDPIRLLQDCAQICATSADFLLRGSDLHNRTCLICAEVCERCADECDRFPSDRTVQQCAEACRTCAESCRRMAEMPA